MAGGGSCERSDFFLLFVALNEVVAPGFHPHLPGFRYQFLAKGLGAAMWFFIFYRAR
jgi:hypothetical protein